MFFALLTLKHYQPGTIEDICRQLEGSKRNRHTEDFVRMMIKESVLRYDGVKQINGREHPVYVRDKKELRAFFEKTIYYHMAERIYTLVDIFSREIG